MFNRAQLVHDADDADDEDNDDASRLVRRMTYRVNISVQSLP